MAAATANRMARERSLALQFSSAGCAALVGSKACNHAQTVAAEAGDDLTTHTSTRATLEALWWRLGLLCQCHKQLTILVEHTLERLSSLEKPPSRSA
jgi:protein-tyrosine-phosphatase